MHGPRARGYRTDMVTALGVGGFMALVMVLNHRCFLELQRSVDRLPRT